MSFLLGLFLTLNFAQAATEQECPDLVERRDEIQIQQVWSSDTQSCFLSVTPRDAFVDLVYRDYLFSTSGLFMVFNSYGSGDEAQTTAAREFYMFPRTNGGYQHAWDDDNRELVVKHVTGDTFTFSYKKAKLKSISRATVTVSDDVIPTNKGGVEINNYGGLLLDGGFKVGGSPTGSAAGLSKFTDAQGKACSVRNKEIFDYLSTGDIQFRYSDSELASFLKTRCPGLQL